MDVIQRCIDGIFFSQSFDVLSKLRTAKNFDDVINKKKLDQIKERIKKDDPN
jgi:hypothetical protein